MRENDQKSRITVGTSIIVKGAGFFCLFVFYHFLVLFFRKTGGTKEAGSSYGDQEDLGGGCRDFREKVKNERKLLIMV